MVFLILHFLTPLFVFQMPGYLVCKSCSTALLYCECTKEEGGRKRAREESSDGEE